MGFINHGLLDLMIRAKSGVKEAEHRRWLQKDVGLYCLAENILKETADRNNSIVLIDAHWQLEDLPCANLGLKDDSPTRQ